MFANINFEEDAADKAQTTSVASASSVRCDYVDEETPSVVPTTCSTDNTAQPTTVTSATTVLGHLPGQQYPRVVASSSIEPQKSSVGRHAVLDDDEIDTIAKNRLSANSEKQTKWAVSLFKGKLLFHFYQ